MCFTGQCNFRLLQWENWGRAGARLRSVYQQQHTSAAGQLWAWRDQHYIHALPDNTCDSGYTSATAAAVDQQHQLGCVARRCYLGYRAAGLLCGPAWHTHSHRLRSAGERYAHAMHYPLYCLTKPCPSIRADMPVSVACYALQVNKVYLNKPHSNVTYDGLIIENVGIGNRLSAEHASGLALLATVNQWWFWWGRWEGVAVANTSSRSMTTHQLLCMSPRWWGPPPPGLCCFLSGPEALSLTACSQCKQGMNRMGQGLRIQTPVCYLGTKKGVGSAGVPQESFLIECALTSVPLYSASTAGSAVCASCMFMPNDYEDYAS